MIKVLKFAGPEVQIATNKSAAPVAPYADDVVATGGGGEGATAAWGILQITRESGTVSLTGPVKVIGTCNGRIVELGILNAGALIAPVTDLGYQELVYGVGLCTAVTILPAGVTGGGAYNAFYRPVSEQ